MRTALKTTLAVLAVVAIAGVLLIVYVANQYVDETFVSGEAHGFAIGDSKEEAYEKARDLYSGKRYFRLDIPGHHQQEAFIIHRATRAPVYDWEPFHFSPDEFPEVAAWDEWQIFPEERFLAAVTLTFTDDRLVKIRWQRKPFDLP